MKKLGILVPFHLIVYNYIKISVGFMVLPSYKQTHISLVGMNFLNYKYHDKNFKSNLN